MHTLLNKEDWNNINDLSNPNLADNFELLIKKYLDKAKNPELINRLPNRKKINILNTIIEEPNWIYRIELKNDISSEKINEERFKAFCELLSSIGMLEDFYTFYGIGPNQDKFLATCYLKLTNKQKSSIQNESSEITNQVEHIDLSNKINTKDAIKLYYKISTSSTIGMPFISGVIPIIYENGNTSNIDNNKI